METVSMSSLVKQVRGVSYKPEDLRDKLDDTSIILLRANNIDDGRINFDDVVYVDRKKVSNDQLLQKENTTMRHKHQGFFDKFIENPPVSFGRIMSLLQLVNLPL